jgi:DNA-binding transcriptional LysR family regulator
VDSLDRQLRYFLKIASLKSLSRAAEALDQTQPGLSRQLATLESCLGQPLFVRNGRGVELTEAGRGLKEKTEAAYRSIDAAVDCVRKHDGVSQGTVRVAAVHTLSYYLLGEIVARFSAECSDVALSLMCRSSSDAAELVENGKADIGLVYDTAVASQTLDTRPLFDDEMCLIATRDSAHGETIDLTEERPRLVAFPAHYALGKMVRQGSLKLPIVAEAETVDTLVKLVAAGMGACILPTRMPDKLLQDNDLRKVRIERPLMRRRVVVITRAGKPQSPLVQRLVDMVLAAVP